MRLTPAHAGSCLVLLLTTTPALAAGRPTATSQAVSTAEDTALSVTLSGSDPSGAALSYTVDTTTPRTRGSVRCTGAACTYTPSADFNGTDSFFFKVSNSTLSSSWATVSVTVIAVNDAPTANSQSGLLVSEDLARTIVLTGSDKESAASALSFQVDAAPAHGSVGISGAIATYTPTPDYSGADSFTFRAWDGAAWSAPATVSLNVAAVADRPTATDQVVTLDEDTPATFTLAAADVDGDSLTPSFGGAVASGVVYTTTSDTHGTFEASGLTVTYTPPADFHGTDTFTYSVSDGLLGSAGWATVTLVVEPVNDAPVATEHWARAVAGDPAHVVLAATDVDGDALTYSIVSSPRRGTATLWNGNRLVYRPTSATARGTDTLSWRASDGTATSTVESVVIDLQPVPARFPLDTLSVDPEVSTWTTDDGNVVLELPGDDTGCQKTWSNQPRIEAMIGGVSVGQVGVVAGHYDTLECGYTDYQAEYSGLHVVLNDGSPGGFEARLLATGHNVQASGTALDDGSLVFPKIGGDDRRPGLVRFSPGGIASTTTITTIAADPLGTASDASVLYDPEGGFTLMMTAVVAEICGAADGDNCGTIGLVGPDLELVDQVDEDDGHHAWGSGACISVYGERYCAFGPGADDSGTDVLDDHACAVAHLDDLPTPPTSSSTVDLTLGLLETFDPGAAGCTSVGSRESSFINGALVSDGLWIYAVALGSDDLDDYARIYQLDFDLTLNQTFEIPADYSHSFTNGFHNSLLVGADGRLYLTGIIDVAATIQYAVIAVDPDTGAVETLSSELVADDNGYGTGHLYVDAAGDEVIAYAAGTTGVVTRLSDGALLDAFTLGDTAGEYVAAPVLIADGNGDADGLMFVSTDNVVTIVPDSGLADDEAAPWPGPRGGGRMQATLD